MDLQGETSYRVGPGDAGRPVARGWTGLTGCRVVTTSESARLLLAGQLSALSDVRWSVVSGDDYPAPPDGVDTYRVPMRRDLALSDFRSFRALYRFFRRHRFDLVQTHTPKASLLGLPAARLAGLRTVYTMHGSLYFKENGPIRNAAAWLFERWCCGWAQQVLVQSREDADVLPRARICRPAKITYIGNGIDLSRFDGTPAAAAEGRPPVVLMISRLVVEKGVPDFFKVAEALTGRAVFVHVGPAESDQRDAIPPAEIQAARLRGGVQFVGAVDDVRPHLAQTDLVVLPSYREGIPRVAMEAAAMGRPVAGYDIRGLREVVPPETGLLAPRGDVTRLTGLVRALVENPEQLPALGAACRERVVTHFSEAKVVARLRDFYLHGAGSP